MSTHASSHSGIPIALNLARWPLFLAASVHGQGSKETSRREHACEGSSFVRSAAEVGRIDDECECCRAWRHRNKLRRTSLIELGTTLWYGG